MGLGINCDRCGKGPLPVGEVYLVRFFEVNESQVQGGRVVDQFYVCQACDREVRSMRVEAAAENRPPEPEVSQPQPAEAVTEIDTAEPAVAPTEGD